MAAPSKKLYIGVLVAFLLFIPAGLLLYHFGPAMGEAWRWRKLGRPMETRGRFAGCVVSSGDSEESLLLDTSGKVLRRWKTRGNYYSGVAALDNGNILFGAGGQVWEIDRDGKEVWRLPGTVKLGSVRDVQRLANGNTLVTDVNGPRAVEFSPAGKEVWSYKYDGYLQSAQRLRNGNTLIGSWNMGAIEVESDGKVVWQHGSPDGLCRARRLANGNTLLVALLAGRVVEIDPAGNVVWEHKCEGPLSAERLPDRRTLISSRLHRRSSLPQPPVRILLVSPDGKEELLYEGPGGRASAVYEESD